MGRHLLAIEKNCNLVCIWCFQECLHVLSYSPTVEFEYVYLVRRINYIDRAPEKQLRVSKLKSLKSCAAYLIFQTVRRCSNTLNYWFVQNVIRSFVPSATCLQDASCSIGYSHSLTEGRWYQLRLHYPLYVHCPGLMCTSALLEVVTNHICVDSQ